MAKVDPSLVAHLPMFAGFTNAELEEILREARSARHPRNSAIFAQGEEAHSFFLLLHGHVRAAKTTPTGAWPRLVQKFPALATNTLQTVGTRLQESHTRVLEMSTQQVEQRIAHALLRLAKQSGKKLDHGIEIDFPISRQDIAQMTGTTLHTVSRILSGWESQGLVESGRQRIILREPHRIFVLAEQNADDGR